MDGSDQASYQQRRESFTRSLHHFHETKGTPFKRIPEFCGQEVDLFRLYNLVTERGGWLKVNRTNGWDDLLENFHLPKHCVNGGNALKHIYIRFLDRYEKVHYLGENGDRNDDEEDMESRHRRWSARAMHTVALTYNHHQHNVGENVRRMQGLSTDLYKPSEYDRLALSLVSPLPNEQDFAINVCTLLSNEGKHFLRLDKCPRLLDYLLAHAGVYNHGNLRKLFEEIYGRVRGHSFKTFWSDVLEFTEYKDLTDEEKFPRSLRKIDDNHGDKSPHRRTPTPEPQTLPQPTPMEVDPPAIIPPEDIPAAEKDAESTNVRVESEKEISNNDVVLNVSTIEPTDKKEPNELLKEPISEPAKDPPPEPPKDPPLESQNLVSQAPSNLEISEEPLPSATEKSTLPASPKISSEEVPMDVDMQVPKNELLGSTPPSLPLIDDSSSIADHSKEEKHQNDPNIEEISPTPVTEAVSEKVAIKSITIENSKESVFNKVSVESSFKEPENSASRTEGSSVSVVEEEKEAVPKVDEEKKTVSTVDTGLDEALPQEEGGKPVTSDVGDERQVVSESQVVDTQEGTEVDKKVVSEVVEEKEAVPEVEVHVETPEEAEERMQREREAAEIERKEREKRLAKEMEEAKYYEAMLKAEEDRKRGPCLWKESSSDEEISVISIRPRSVQLSLEKEDCELFNLGRESGTRDIIGQRVLQVANILRNLSFCEEVVSTMAQSTSFLRFLLLCANSRWSNLHQLGLDMLGNVAPELKLEDPLFERIGQVLFGTVSRGIRHSDRFVVLSSLEVLNKVCQRDENEDIVTKTLDQEVYEHVCELMSLHDIMILLYTLECLYSISSMGEKPCNLICRSRGAIQMLLSLVTVEAQSYGPKACILMRVIETVSGGVGSTQATPHPPPPLQTLTPQQKIITPQLMRAPSPKTVLGMPMGAVATPVQVPNPCPTVVSQPPQMAAVSQVMSVVPPMPTVQQQHAHQQTVQENEQFALAWVRANYELSAGGKVDQHEMYNKYVESCAKMERRGVITSAHFPRFVRSVFGGTVGPKPAQNPQSSGMAHPYYDGIQVRDTPLTINVKLVPVTEVPARRRGGVSPILKAQLVSPGRVTPPLPNPNPILPVATQVSSASTSSISSAPATPPCVSPATVQTSLGEDSQPDSDNASSSLIKSLLASKVTQRQAQQAKLLQAQQQHPVMINTTPTPLQQQTPVAAKIMRINGVIQETPADSNHLPPTGVKGKKEPPQPPPRLIKVDAEDSDSRASSSRDFPTAAGCTLSSTEDNENSLTSFEGIFLNGIDLEAAVVEGVKVKEKSDAVSETIKPRSMMLADLLDKKEIQPVNGVIGEKGLELVEKAILTDKTIVIGEKGLEFVEKTILTDKTIVLNNGVESVQVSRTSDGGSAEDNKRSVVDVGVFVNEDKRLLAKRPADSHSRDAEPAEKKARTERACEVVDIKEENGEDSSRSCDKQEVNGEEEVRASSKAANLFAALAAEALEDETDLEIPTMETQQNQVTSSQNTQMRPVFLGDQQQLIVTGAGPGAARQIIVAPSQSGQVLISAGGQLTLQKPPSGGAPAQSVPVVLQNQRLVQTGVAQQYIVQSGNSAQPMLLTQTPGTVIQGQTQTVLLTQTSQQQGTPAKTIIILQPQPSAPGAPAQQQKIVLSSQGGNVVVGRPVSESPPALVTSSREVPEVSITQNGSQLHVVRAGQAGTTAVAVGTSTGATTNGACQQIQVISSGIQSNAPTLTEKCNSPGLDHSVYLCEWRSCMRSFKAASEVYLHVCSCHCPVDPEQETQCLWGRCDGMKRKRFSLMTHLYDRHCNSDILNMMAMRRRQLNTQGRTDIPIPTPTPPHPGYGPNAAFHAIKRHAGDFANPKELMPKPQAKSAATTPAPPPPPTSAALLAKAAATPVQVKDDNEGPVTKSIRLTASLILRNLVIYSSIGRRFLKGYEPHLANIALSNVESSRTIAQVLADLNDTSSSAR